MPEIHPTAEVSRDAVLAPDVRIGPGCIITGKVTLGAGVRLMGGNYVQGPTTIGDGTVLYPHCCVGFEPQDVKFKPGDPTPGVVIGTNCTLREHVTIHAASKPDGPTRLGNNVFMLVNSHVGHDTVVGNDVTMINNAMVAGHCQIGDNVLLSGSVGIHQFCRVGRYAMIAGTMAISYDLPPFCVCNQGNRIGGINRVGLRRAGFPREHITAIVRAYLDVLRDPKHRDSMIAELRLRAQTLSCPPLTEMADFLATTKRGICPGMGKPPRDAVAWFKNVQKLIEQPALVDGEEEELV